LSMQQSIIFIVTLRQDILQRNAKYFAFCLTLVFKNN